MRKISLASAILLLLASPQIASAITLDTVAAQTDCDGWSADLGIVVRSGAFMGRLEYAVVLQDAGGAEVQRFDYGEMLDLPGTATFTVTVGGAWDAPLDGDYTVSGEFFVYDIFGDGYNTSSGSFSLDPGCGGAGGGEEPTGDGCAYGARHWSENPDLWPVQRLHVAGRDMDQPELMAVLALQRNSFLKFHLMRELIAAKLNLANGAGDAVAPFVDEADAMLASLQSARRGGRATGEAMRLKAALRRFNMAGCPGGGSGVSMSLGNDFLLEADLADKAAVESVSLGSLKALYH